MQTIKDILYFINDSIAEVHGQSGDMDGIKIMAPIYLEHHILNFHHTAPCNMAAVHVHYQTRVIHVQGIRIQWGYSDEVIVYHYMWPALGEEAHKLPVGDMNDVLIRAKQMAKKS